MNINQSTTRAASISRHLEELILDGTLQPGDQVPSERQLAQRLNASRPLVREALKELRGRGVIETRQGKGSFIVGMVKEVEQSSPLMKLYKNHPRLLYDLLEVRELLEGQAASLAAQRGSEKDFYKITQAYEAMANSQTQQTDLTTATHLDHDFHRCIYEASHNPVLIHTLQGLMQLMLNSVMASVSNLYHRNQQKQLIDHHHKQIWKSIIERKPKAAEKAATEHIRSVRDKMREIEQEEQRLVRAELWNNLSNNH